jgi:hypothetical protein
LSTTNRQDFFRGGIGCYSITAHTKFHKITANTNGNGIGINTWKWKWKWKWNLEVGIEVLCPDSSSEAQEL